MSVSIRDKTTGEWVQVAGHGKAEYGASTVRKGTSASVTISAGYIEATVGITFADPMPDANYEVILYNTQGIGSQWPDFIPCVKNKTKNGFEVQFNTIKNEPVASGVTLTCNVAYTAFKLYTDTEYNNLLDLPDRVETIEGSIKDSIRANEDSINSLNNTVNSHGNSINSLNNKINSLNNTVNSLNGRQNIRVSLSGSTLYLNW